MDRNRMLRTYHRRFLFLVLTLGSTRSRSSSKYSTRETPITAKAIIYFDARSNIWPAFFKPVDRISDPGDFTNWSFRAGVADRHCAWAEEIGRGQGQRHREICSAGSVGIVAWIQFRDCRRPARGASRTSG